MSVEVIRLDDLVVVVDMVVVIDVDVVTVALRHVCGLSYCPLVVLCFVRFVKSVNEVCF